MLVFPIRDYLTEPGELVEFRASAPASALAGGGGPAHPVGACDVQATHVRRYLTAPEEGHGWLATFFDLPGRVDVGALARAWQAWLRRHDALRTWFTADGAGLTRRLLPPQAVTVHPVGLGVRASGEAVRTWMHERFAEAINPVTWPGFVAGAVLRDEKSTLFFAVDHAHTDGCSLARVFSEIRALYTAETGGAPARLPETGSHLDYCVAEARRNAALDPAHPVAARWVDFLGRGLPASFALPLGVDPGGRHPSVYETVDLFDLPQAEAFARACRRGGSSFAAGAVGALALAEHELAGTSHYRRLMVAHTRGERRWHAAQGWFVNLVPVEFPVPRGRSFAATATAAHDALGRAHAMAEVSPARVLELHPAAALALGNTVPPVLSYVDLRHTPGSRDWTAARFGVLGSGAPVSGVSVWLWRLWQGLRLTVAYPDNPVARDSVHRYVRHLRRILDAAVGEPQGTAAYGPQGTVEYGPQDTPAYGPQDTPPPAVGVPRAAAMEPAPVGGV
ncbi:condensation domain-containing protein [Kitasatospora sp. NPDC101447]|uniref:condensation domain-containing protein n=1 Tax=Kitasatospora sp. NPDC101447 TaxID=3364102 RepID=UPI00380F9893